MNKKSTILLLLALPVYAIAADQPKAIDLPLTENVEQQKTTYNASLEKLPTDSLYQISCSINNNENNSPKVLLETRLLPTSQYGEVELNGKAMPNNSDTLQNGNNLLTFKLLIGKSYPSKYNAFILTNFAAAPFRIGQCSATEILPPKSAETNNKQATRALKATPGSSGGWFTVYNETDYIVSIAVGNFIPTPYTISPHNSKWVSVSTDNQDIHIKYIQR